MNNDFLNKRDEIIEKYFVPVISEESRKTGQTILLISIALIFINFGFLKEIKIHGAQLTDQALVIGLLLILIYKLIVYIISVIEDHSKKPSGIDIATLTGDLNHEIITENRNNNELLYQSNILIQNRLQKQKELTSEEFYNYCKNDGLDSLQKTLFEKLNDNTLKNSLDRWKKDLNKIKNLRQARFIIEVVFTIPFGLVTIIIQFV